MPLRILLSSVLVVAAVLVTAPRSGGQDAAQSAAPRPAAEAVSHLVRPMYLGAEPPDCRAVRSIQIAFATADKPLPGVTRSREEARELAGQVAQLARAGKSFSELYGAHADGPPNRNGVLGSFPPGVLLPGMDAFLKEAAIGDVSDPIEAGSGFHVVQRIERYAACRYVLVRKRSEGAPERIETVRARAAAGESLADIAADFTTQQVQLFESIFERGPDDRMVKAAAFEEVEGRLFGPLESAEGPVFGRRIPVDELGDELRENQWVRGRAILIAHEDVGGPVALTDRSAVEARDLAKELHRRIQEGEADMVEIAREFNEDAMGKERGGDLGWLYRRNPRMSPPLARLFLAKPGELLDPIPIEIGWLILRRES